MNLEKIYPPRKADAHKGDFGYVLIVAGSKMYSGSPLFNSMSALRCGADLTTVVGHRRAMDIVAGFAPDLITYPLEGEFSAADIPATIELSRKFDALVLGGGMERSQKSFDAISALVREIDLPMVLDAEAVRAIAADRGALEGKKAVLTPNAIEFEALTGEQSAPDVEARKEQVARWASELGAVIIQKGAADVISDGKQVRVNRTGTPFMSKGGFGDTLAGICGALLARGVDPFAAAEAACHINGKAGEVGGERYGESLLASDLFEIYPEVIRGR